MSVVTKILIGFVAAFAAIQLVPYGRAHENPSTNIEPDWRSPEERALVERACFDCHSNQTKWPWYSNVAPVSWLVQHDVEDGRKHLNFSEWNRPQKKIFDAAEEVDEGEMPMPIYLLMHSEAKLSAAEKDKIEDILVDVASKIPTKQ